MNWYLQSNSDSDVTISTKIKFERNLKNFKFNLNNQEIDKLENTIKENLYAIGYGLKFLKIKDMDNITKLSLVEKRLIPKDFAFNKTNSGSILVNDEENICIMIGGENHLAIQVFCASFDLDNIMNLAIEIDKKLDDILGYAVNRKYGFLTTSPMDVGTGLRASVIVHLPALSKTGNDIKILNTIIDLGMNVQSIEKEKGVNNSLCDMYEISNKQTIGITEKDIVKNLKIIVKKIMEQERETRRMLAKDEIEIEDMIYRSYGILANCKKISYEEMIKLLSNIKLGTDLGILKEISDLKVQKLYLYSKEANLQKYFGEEYGVIERNIKRAEMIKNILKEK